jgi:hypothetical protein
LNVGCFDASRPCEGIEVSYCKIAWQVSSDVEGSAFRCRDWNSVDQHDVLSVDPLVANHDAAGRTTASPDHLDGRFRIDPQRAVECGCRTTSNDAFATRPQPRADGAMLK